MAITAGAGGGATTNGTTTATTDPILIHSGDKVLALSYVSTNVQFTPSSSSNPVWRQLRFVSVSPYFVYLWVLDNPVPANEPVTFSRVAAGAGLALVQVYSGVKQIGNTAGATSIYTFSPALSVVVTTTVDESVVVAGFVFNRGTNHSYAPAGHRLAFSGSAGTVLFTDHDLETVSPPADTLLVSPATFTTPTGFQYVSVLAVLEPFELPTASLSASPNTITVGQSTTLSWSTTNATAVTISGIGPVALSGSQEVSPGETTLYTLTATGQGGTETAAFMVEVIQPSILPIGGGGFKRQFRRRKQRGAVWTDEDLANHEY